MLENLFNTCTDLQMQISADGAFDLSKKE